MTLFAGNWSWWRNNKSAAKIFTKLKDTYPVNHIKCENKTDFTLRLSKSYAPFKSKFFMVCILCRFFTSVVGQKIILMFLLTARSNVGVVVKLLACGTRVLGFDSWSRCSTFRDWVFSLLRQEYPPILTSGEMLSHPGGWDKPILEVIHLWRHRTSTPNNLEKSRLVGVLDIFCTFLDKNEKNNQHHIEGGARESHPRVQDLQHPRLGKPRRGLQIWTLGWDSLVPPSMWC